MHVEFNKTKTFRPLLLCMINTPHGLSEYTNIWVHPIKTFLWQHILRIPFFYIRPKNRLHFYIPCQVLVINLDKTSSMAKFSWSFVRWAMLQTVNWVILPNGMMQNTLQLIMPQVCHITCSAILPALTLWPYHYHSTWICENINIKLWNKQTNKQKTKQNKTKTNKQKTKQNKQKTIWEFWKESLYPIKFGQKDTFSQS